MPFDRRAAEARREAVHELAGERDLGQHDQRLPAPLQRARHGLEVDLGLAGAGDAVEQRDGEALRVGGGAHGVDGERLRVGELNLAVGRVGHRQPALGDRHLDQRAGLDQAVDDAGRATGFRGQRHLGAHQPVGGDLERALAGRRHARRLGRVRVARDAEARLARLEHGRRAHHHAHDHAERRERVARHPFGKAQRQGGQRRHVGERGGDDLQLLVGDRLARLADGAVPDHADALLRPERHQHEGAGAGFQTIGKQVVVGLVERDGQQHGHAPGQGRGGRAVFLQWREQALQARDPAWEGVRPLAQTLPEISDDQARGLTPSRRITWRPVSPIGPSRIRTHLSSRPERESVESRDPGATSARTQQPWVPDISLTRNSGMTVRAPPTRRSSCR